MKTLHLIIFLTSSSLISRAQEWQADRAHSSVVFAVEHMVISEVKGRFNDFEATVNTTSDDFENANIHFEALVASINTANGQRDEHLKSEDFFHIEKFPTITFESTDFKKIENGKYSLSGNLTMHGITKPITLDVKYNGSIKDPWGNTRAGFKAVGIINRYDYGLEYNSVMEAGGLMIGKEVNIEINLELVQKK